MNITWNLQAVNYDCDRDTTTSSSRHERDGDDRPEYDNKELIGPIESKD